MKKTNKLLLIIINLLFSLISLSSSYNHSIYLGINPINRLLVRNINISSKSATDQLPNYSGFVAGIDFLRNWGIEYTKANYSQNLPNSTNKYEESINNISSKFYFGSRNLGSMSDLSGYLSIDYLQNSFGLSSEDKHDFSSFGGGFGIQIGILKFFRIDLFSKYITSPNEKKDKPNEEYFINKSNNQALYFFGLSASLVLPFNKRSELDNCNDSCPKLTFQKPKFYVSPAKPGEDPIEIKVTEKVKK